jgi:hypothetical protein
MEAIKNGVATIERSREDVYKKTLEDILDARKTMDILMENNIIHKPDTSLLEDAVKKAIEAVK